jgi:hypothetical protein
MIAFSPAAICSAQLLLVSEISSLGRFILPSEAQNWFDHLLQKPLRPEATRERAPMVIIAGITGHVPIRHTRGMIRDIERVLPREDFEDVLRPWIDDHPKSRMTLRVDTVERAFHTIKIKDADKCVTLPASTEARFALAVAPYTGRSCWVDDLRVSLHLSPACMERLDWMKELLVQRNQAPRDAPARQKRNEGRDQARARNPKATSGQDDFDLNSARKKSEFEANLCQRLNQYFHLFLLRSWARHFFPSVPHFVVGLAGRIQIR